MAEGSAICSWWCPSLAALAREMRVHPPSTSHLVVMIPQSPSVANASARRWLLRPFATSAGNEPAGNEPAGNEPAPAIKRKRRPMTEETKQKISASMRGKRVQSPETREKIAHAMANRELSLTHRLRISESRKGAYHSSETRKVIGDAVHATKQRLRKERLAERAARAAAAATADLARPTASGQEGLILDEIDLERAVIEVTRLRDELISWMNAYELETGRQPDLTETSESIPEVYGRFVRYVALRDLVRRSSVRMGATPVVWT